MTSFDLQLITTINAHDSSLNWVGFGKSGKIFLSSGRDGLIHIWDTSNLKKIFTLTGHKGNISEFLFSPSKSHVLSISQDGTLGYWNIKKRYCERHFGAIGQFLCNAAFFDNGTKLCISDTDGNFQLIDLYNDHLTKVFTVEGSRGHFFITEDGKLIITDRVANDHILWLQTMDIFDGHVTEKTQIFPLGSDTEILYRFIVEPNGQYAIVVTWETYSDDTAQYRFVNLVTHECSTIVNPASLFVSNGLAFSKKGGKAFFPISPNADLYRLGRISLGSKFGKLRKIGIFWNVNSNCYIAPLLSDSEIIRFSKFFARDKYLITGSEHTGILSIWNSSNGRIVARSQKHSDSIMCIDVHEYGRKIITACYDGTIGVWRY